MTDIRKSVGARRVHMASLAGHRQSYQDLFTRMFDLTPSMGRIGRRNFAELVRAQSLLFGTIDDDYRGFFIVSLARAFLGRRTVGLFLRPQTCFGYSGLRYTIKRFAFMALKPICLVSVFTIVPFSVAPQYRRVATGGVLDPQLWDIEADATVPCDADMTTRVRTAAQGRRVLAFLGTVSAGKGIEFLLDLMTDPAWPHDQLLPVVAGRFPDDTQPLSAQLSDAGALVLDRFISEDELQTLYTCADLVWACYRSDYDQASGIFGRAIQFGKTPVVRAGSLIASLAESISIQMITLDNGASSQAGHLRDAAEKCGHGGLATMPIEGWKQEFETTIRSAL